MRKSTTAGNIGKKLKALWTDSRSYKKRLLIAGTAMLAYCFTLIFFGPLEMVAFGGNAMSYSWQDIWWFMAVTALAVFVTGTLLLSLLRGKVFNFLVNLVFTLTLCSYLQAAFMNGSLGILNGDNIDWHTQTSSMLANLLAWVILFAVSYFGLYLSKKIWMKAIIFISVLLVVMQTASTVSIVITKTEDTDPLRNYGLCASGMYEYSPEDNIFIFVLDRLDYDFIEQVLKEDPDFFNALDGFTGYNNATSSYARTQPALNHILTGSESAYFCSTKDFYANSWTEDGKDILGDLHAQGYSVELYTKLTYLFSDLSYAQKNVDNLDLSEKLDPIKSTSKLLRLSAYRYSPIALKPFFWEDTNFYNEDMFGAKAAASYHFNDPAYAPGFRTSTADRDQPCFKFYHFHGSHSPYNMNADGTASDTSTTVKAQTMGSFRNLFAAFAQMKELGIYEDATIIITADHGNAVSDRQPVQKQTRIGLFYKPSGSADIPFVWSSAPVCTDNIPATIVKAAGLTNITPYGIPLDDVSEGDQVERYYYKTRSANGSYNEEAVYQYRIIGDAADFNNWEIIKTTEELPDENGFY